MTTISIPVANKVPTRSLVWFGWFTLSFMVLVILWGALVRATGSGAGCGANWPLCNGDFVPHHPRIATIIEFTHRSMTGVCTFLVVALAAWTFAGTPRGHRARRSVVWSMVLLVTEALLGALLVLRGYVEMNASAARVVAQVIHFTNTFMLLGALSLTAWLLGRRDRTVAASAPGSRGLVVTGIVATLTVGATGSLAALADTLFPSTSLLAGLSQDFAAASPWIVRMRWIHPAAAVVGLICVVLLARRLGSRLSVVVAGLYLLQVVIGVLDVLLLAPTWMQVFHLLGADLFWVALIALSAEVLWPESVPVSLHSRA